MKDQSWILLSTDCTTKEIPDDLASVLNAEAWEAESFTSKSGRLTLLLHSGSEEKIDKVALVEVT